MTASSASKFHQISDELWDCIEEVLPVDLFTAQARIG